MEEILSDTDTVTVCMYYCVFADKVSIEYGESVNRGCGRIGTGGSGTAGRSCTVGGGAERGRRMKKTLWLWRGIAIVMTVIVIALGYTDIKMQKRVYYLHNLQQESVDLSIKIDKLQQESEE